MININIEVKPIVFKSGTKLSEEGKAKARKYFEKNLLSIFRDIRGRE